MVTGFGTVSRCVGVWERREIANAHNKYTELLYGSKIKQFENTIRAKARRHNDNLNNLMKWASLVFIYSLIPPSKDTL